jgi:hypothetical protein
MMPHERKIALIKAILLFFMLLSFWGTITVKVNCLEAAINPARPIKNRPDGWNGIRWGNTPNALGPRRSMTANNTAMGVQYIIPGETAVLGKAQIKEIKYYFKENILIAIDFLYPETEKNELMNYVSEKFGPPQFEGLNETKFVWFDDFLCIYVNMDSNNYGLSTLRYLLKSFSNGKNFPAFPFKPIKGKERIKNLLDIKIGDDFDLISNDLIMLNSNGKFGSLMFKKNNEVTELEGLKIKSINYNVLDSKMFLTDVFFDDSVKVEQVQKCIIQLIGTPNYVSKDGQFFAWYDGSDFDAMLLLDENEKIMRLSYGFFSVLDKNK